MSATRTKTLRDCPPWCQDATEGHEDSEWRHPDDRVHYSKDLEQIVLEAMRPKWEPEGERVGEWYPRRLNAYLMQKWREAEPLLEVTLDDGDLLDLTLHEAHWLYYRLDELLRAAGVDPAFPPAPREQVSAE